MKPTLTQRAQSALGNALWELGAVLRSHRMMDWGWKLVSAQWRDAKPSTFDQRDYDA